MQTMLYSQQTYPDLPCELSYKYASLILYWDLRSYLLPIAADLVLIIMSSRVLAPKMTKVISEIKCGKTELALKVRVIHLWSVEPILQKREVFTCSCWMKRNEL